MQFFTVLQSSVLARPVVITLDLIAYSNYALIIHTELPFLNFSLVARELVYMEAA